MQQSDVVMLACPYTRETHHIANSEMLALMKPTAYLINVTRGKNVDQQALIEVLKEQRIAGAGLGVFDTELLPIDNPLWDMKNVIITPHNAGLSQHRPRLTGEPLRNAVDLNRGF